MRADAESNKSHDVHALVTDLTVIKNFKVFREAKAISGQKTLGATGGNKLRSEYFLFY